VERDALVETRLLEQVEFHRLVVTVEQRSTGTEDDRVGEQQQFVEQTCS
jgi:hypothetical protein